VTQTGVQLHTFRNIETSFDNLLQRVAAHGFDGVEFAHQIHDAEPRTVADTLDETGLTPIGAHVSLSRLETEFESLTEQYRTIGCSTIIIPHISPSELLSLDRIDVLSERLVRLAGRLEDDGFDLVVHNTKHMHLPIVARFGTARLLESNVVPSGAFVYFATGLNEVSPGRLRGTSAFERLVELTETAGIEFEIDVEHAVGVGRDPRQLFEAVGERLFAVHLSDGVRERTFPPTYRSTPLNHGNVDIEQSVRDAFQHGADWLIGEVDDHPEPESAFRSIIRTMEAAIH
jgi:sugar phosphate isomerase/epimerase